MKNKNYELAGTVAEDAPNSVESLVDSIVTSREDAAELGVLNARELRVLRQTQPGSDLMRGSRYEVYALREGKEVPRFDQGFYLVALVRAEFVEDKLYGALREKGAQDVRIISSTEDRDIWGIFAKD